MLVLKFGIGVSRKSNMAVIINLETLVMCQSEESDNLKLAYLFLRQ